MTLKNKRDQFKTELKKLMLKHNVDCISFDFADCSDMHGVYDEKIVITDKEDNIVLEVAGYYLSVSDIK